MIGLGAFGQHYLGGMCKESLNVSLGIIFIITGCAVVLLVIINSVMRLRKHTGVGGIVMVTLTFVFILGVTGLIITLAAKPMLVYIIFSNFEKLFTLLLLVIVNWYTGRMRL